MRCGSCGLQNREHARFCDGCGSRLGSEERSEGGTTARECISCGKPIDLGVYFTMCPHCGFNYRIEISPVRSGPGTTMASRSGLYAVSILVPIAGFVIGAILSKNRDSQSRRLADGCVALGALNIIITPVLILKFFGLA